MILNNICVYQIKFFSINYLYQKLKTNNVAINKIKKIDDFTYLIEVNIWDCKKFKKIFPDAIIIKKDGIIANIFKLLNKKTTTISLIVGLSSFCFFEQLIFKVNIYGTSNIINKNIYTILSNNNITTFTFKPSKGKIEEIKEEILLENKMIEKLEVDTSGTILNISYRIKEKEISGKTVNNKYYAKSDGIINKIEIEYGNCIYKINDYVKKGELLIDDHLIINENPIYVGALGKIFAYTWKIVEIRANSYVDEIQSYMKLLEDARYEIGKEFQENEYIKEEKIISYLYDEKESYIKIHYTLNENIAIYQ